ncbi:MAG: hypothetical protein J7J76_05030 [Candidatus Latescibacteria bacterium]|nr:hypothetical protein [Candidatus Latescibacterota bacterium]
MASVLCSGFFQIGYGVQVLSGRGDEQRESEYEAGQEAHCLCRREGVILSGRIFYECAVTEATVLAKTAVEYSDGTVAQRVQDSFENL